MRALVASLLMLCLAAGSCWAKVSVSPVILEAADVRAGDCFRILCRQTGEQPVDVQLSLALFDQDEEGKVVFLEDEASRRKARAVLSLSRDAFRLDSQNSQIVEVELLNDDFHSLYAVLFVKSDQPGIRTRLAVLLLLSAWGPGEDVWVTSCLQAGEEAELTVANGGKSHGLWRGELLCYDAAGRLGGRLRIESGIILPQRSKDLRVELPRWVRHVEIGDKK